MCSPLRQRLDVVIERRAAAEHYQPRATTIAHLSEIIEVFYYR